MGSSRNFRNSKPSTKDMHGVVKEVVELKHAGKAAPAEQRFLVDQLRDGALSRVMLVGIEGGDAATRARVSAALVRALGADARFASVSNGATLGWERERDLLLA